MPSKRKRVQKATIRITDLKVSSSQYEFRSVTLNAIYKNVIFKFLVITLF